MYVPSNVLIWPICKLQCTICKLSIKLCDLQIVPNNFILQHENQKVQKGFQIGRPIFKSANLTEHVYSTLCIYVSTDCWYICQYWLLIYMSVLTTDVYVSTDYWYICQYWLLMYMSVLTTDKLCLKISSVCNFRNWEFWVWSKVKSILWITAMCLLFHLLVYWIRSNMWLFALVCGLNSPPSLLSLTACIVLSLLWPFLPVAAVLHHSLCVTCCHPTC